MQVGSSILLWLTMKKRKKLRQDIELLENVLGSVYLHGNWTRLTKPMTTPEKERFLKAVEKSSIRLDPTLDHDHSYLAWWRNDDSK